MARRSLHQRLDRRVVFALMHLDVSVRPVAAMKLAAVRRQVATGGVANAWQPALNKVISEFQPKTFRTPFISNCTFQRLLQA